MDFTNLTEMYIPIVMVICLCVGYIIKHWITDIDNKLIPTLMGILGAVLACVSGGGITLDLIASGLITGLASTGMHQVFKNLIENGK
jgi:hypothetical protein